MRYVIELKADDGCDTPMGYFVADDMPPAQTRAYGLKYLTLEAAQRDAAVVAQQWGVIARAVFERPQYTILNIDTNASVASRHRGVWTFNERYDADLVCDAMNAEAGRAKYRVVQEL